MKAQNKKNWKYDVLADCPECRSREYFACMKIWNETIAVDQALAVRHEYRLFECTRCGTAYCVNATRRSLIFVQPALIPMASDIMDFVKRQAQPEALDYNRTLLVMTREVVL